MLKNPVFILIAFVLCSCDLSPPEGKLNCNTDEDCPENWICYTDSLCYSSEDAIKDTEASDESDADSADSSTETIDAGSDTTSDSDSETNGTDSGSESDSA